MMIVKGLFKEGKENNSLLPKCPSFYIRFMHSHNFNRSIVDVDYLVLPALIGLFGKINSHISAINPFAMSSIKVS